MTDFVFLAKFLGFNSTSKYHGWLKVLFPNGKLTLKEKKKLVKKNNLIPLDFRIFYLLALVIGSYWMCVLHYPLIMQALLNRVGYTQDISHGMLVEMAEHRQDLEKKTKPIMDTLRSYQDLPPVIPCTDWYDIFIMHLCSLISGKKMVYIFLFCYSRIKL